MGQLVLDNVDLQLIKALGRSIAKYAMPQDIIICTGSLGAGKTTLIKEICSNLNVEEEVTSPSFTIINKYKAKYDIFHIDFYRLNNFDDVNNLDIEDIFASKNNIIFIEWANNFTQLLPKHHFEIIFDIKNHFERKLSFKSFGERYNDLLKHIKNEYNRN